MEVSFIDIEDFSIKTCRCCLMFSEDETMDNIYECVYQDIELHEILNLLVPIAIVADDGKKLDYRMLHNQPPIQFFQAIHN